MRQLRLRGSLTLLPLLLCLPLVALSPLGCAKAPPTLSPAGERDFRKLQVVKALDLLRDFAIDAEAQTPKALSTATTRKVVLYHQSTLTIIHATDTGWQAAVATGLTDVLATLDAPDRQKLAPYAALLIALVQEIAR